MSIILHIGWPKTGTTAFQRNVLFPQRGRINVEGNNLSDDRWSVLESFYDISPPAGSFLDKYKGRAQADWPLIYSEERLLLRTLCGDDFFDKVKSIAKVEEVKVVAFIRNQEDWLKSFFREKSSGGTMDDGLDDAQGVGNQPEYNHYSSLSHWLDAIIKENRLGGGLLEIANYNYWYHGLRSIVGPNNLTFLPYELLDVSPTLWAEKISQATSIPCDDIMNGMRVKEYVSGARLHDHWLGKVIKPMRGVWAVELVIKRVRSNSAAQKLLSLTRLAESRQSLSEFRPDQVDYLREFYRKDNCHLSEAIGMDLSALGYWT